LESELEKIRKAEGRVKVIEKALELHDTLEQINQTTADISAYPPALNKISGQEDTDLERISKDRKQYSRQRKAAQVEIQKAKEQIQESGLCKEPISEEELTEFELKLSYLQEKRARIDSLKEVLGTAEEELLFRRDQLGSGTSTEKLGSLTAQDYAEMESFQRKWQDFLLRERTLREKSDILGEQLGSDDPQFSLSDCQQALKLLREWISASTAFKTAARILSLLIFAIALAALFLTPQTHKTPGNYFLILEILLALVSVVFFWLASKDSGRKRKGIQREFLSSHFPGPASWNSKAVQDLMNDLEHRSSELRDRAQKLNERDDILALLSSLDKGREELTTERRALCQRFGLDEKLGDLSLHLLASDLEKFQKYSRKVEQDKTSLSLVQADLDSLVHDFNQLFSSFDLEKASSVEALSARFTQLKGNIAKYLRARDILRREEDTLRNIDQQIHRCAQEEARIFEKLGLTQGDLRTLESLLNDRSKYDSLQQRLHSFELQRDSQTAFIQNLDKEVLSLSRSEVENEHAGLKKLLSEQLEINSRISSVRAIIEEVKKKKELEEALRNAEAIQAELMNHYQQAVMNNMSNFMLDLIEEEYRVESQPEVFREACRLFRLFTRGHYTLLPSASEQDSSPFRALDQVENRGLELHQLSCGTRTQLQLAVRIAFAREHEGPLCLPLLFDEVLSTSDPERFAAIAASLLSLVKEGRQVFYFTCQPGDASAWKEHADQAGLQDLAFFDMQDTGPVEIKHTDVFQQSDNGSGTLEKPLGRSLREYVQVLRVPPFQPEEGADSTHLAYLVSDPESLYELLKCGISKAGQLRELKSAKGTGAYIAPEKLEEILVRADLLDAFSSSWQSVKGKKLTPEAILAVCSSDVFAPQIIDKARKLGWDARALLDAIHPDTGKAIKRLHRTLFQALEEYFYSNEYFVKETSNDRDIALARVLAIMESQVSRKKIDPEEIRHTFDQLWEQAEKQV